MYLKFTNFSGFEIVFFCFETRQVLETHRQISLNKTKIKSKHHGCELKKPHPQQ